MVSDQEAKDKLVEAHDFVNGDPENRVQEFLLCRKERSEDEESEDVQREIISEEIPFHSDIRIELNSIFVENLYKEVNNVVKKETKPISEYEATNIEESTKPLQYIPASDIPSFDLFDDLISGNGFPETSYEDFDSPDFQIFRVRDQWGKMFVGFRTFTDRQIVGSSWKVKITLRDDEYDTFEDDLIALPENLDAFYYDEVLYVINQGKFETLFDYLREYKRKAKEVFEGLTESDIKIHDMADFSESVINDTRALRKMQKVQQRGLYNDLTPDIVDEVIDEFDLEVQSQVIDDEWGIVLPDKRNKWDIIRLLNDDHLYSSLTDGKYQVKGGKEPR